MREQTNTIFYFMCEMAHTHTLFYIQIKSESKENTQKPTQTHTQ